MQNLIKELDGIKFENQSVGSYYINYKPVYGAAGNESGESLSPSSEFLPYWRKAKDHVQILAGSLKKVIHYHFIVNGLFLILALDYRRQFGYNFCLLVSCKEITNHARAQNVVQIFEESLLFYVKISKSKRRALALTAACSV
jgi:hypothetical protein